MTEQATIPRPRRWRERGRFTVGDDVRLYGVRDIGKVVEVEDRRVARENPRLGTIQYGLVEFHRSGDLLRAWWPHFNAIEINDNPVPMLSWPLTRAIREHRGKVSVPRACVAHDLKLKPDGLTGFHESEAAYMGVTLIDDDVWLRMMIEAGYGITDPAEWGIES